MKGLSKNEIVRKGKKHFGEGIYLSCRTWCRPIEHRKKSALEIARELLRTFGQSADGRSKDLEKVVGDGLLDRLK